VAAQAEERVVLHRHHHQALGAGIQAHHPAAQGALDRVVSRIVVDADDLRIAVLDQPKGELRVQAHVHAGVRVHACLYTVVAQHGLQVAQRCPGFPELLAVVAETFVAPVAQLDVADTGAAGGFDDVTCVGLIDAGDGRREHGDCDAVRGQRLLEAR